MKNWIPIFFVGLALFGCVDGKDQSSDEAAIRRKSQEYVDAFNKRDAAKLASLWHADAEYTNLTKGRTVSGREEILGEFAEILEDWPEITLEVSIDSISFPTKDRAVEVGTGKVTNTEVDEKEIRYRAIYEFDNGEWLLVNSSKVDVKQAPTNYEKLKDLEWLVGEWEDADEDVQVESKYEWDKYKNFLKHHYTVNILGKEQLEGKRIIGWDPVNEVIHSWHFDSFGGFAEANWKKVGKQWVIESINTLPDGGLGTQIHVLSPIDNDSFTYEISGRMIDGEILPSVGPIKVVRKRG